MGVSLISTVLSPENSNDRQLLQNTPNLHFLGFFGHEKTFDSFFPAQAFGKMLWEIEFFILFFIKNKIIPSRTYLDFAQKEILRQKNMNTVTG